MKLSIVSIVCILFMQCVISQDTIGCFVEGECFQSLYIDEEATEDEFECLEFCQETDDCLYFTYFANSRACVALANCDVFDQNCDDCISGERSCEAPPDLVCNEPGQCLGSFVGTDAAADLNDCLEQCQDNEDCQWWSYDFSDGLCLFTRDCPEVDDCDTCVHGQTECEPFEGTTATPGITAPTEPPTTLSTSITEETTTEDDDATDGTPPSTSKSRKEIEHPYIATGLESENKSKLNRYTVRCTRSASCCPASR